MVCIVNQYYLTVIILTAKLAALRLKPNFLYGIFKLFRYNLLFEFNLIDVKDKSYCYMVFLYNILWLVSYVLHVWFYRRLSLVQCSVVVACTFLARHFFLHCRFCLRW